MSEPKDRRRRLVPSVNTVKKKPPAPVVKTDTPAVLKSPGVIKDTRLEANTSKVIQPPGKAQVFVLSPAILKQMGINIGNLQQNLPNEEVNVTTKKKGRQKKPKGNSEDVKKALYNKLTEKKNKNTNPPQQIEENEIPEKAITSEPNHPIKVVELLKTFNIPQKDEFVKPASPLVCRKSSSSNMETVSYFTSSLVMSPGEDISNYLAGYNKIPNTNFSDASNIPTGSSHYAAEGHPINSSVYSVPLHPVEDNGISSSIHVLNQNANRHINMLPPSDELNNSRNFVKVAVSGGNLPECGAEHYYKIQMHPDHEEALTEQIQLIDGEIQLNSQLVNSNPNQNGINISLTDIQNMTENSLDEGDGSQDISESNDETFDYIIEDVNSDEIEKVDLMNVDFDLLNKETNEDMEHQQSYLCPVEANADSSQVILGGSGSMPSCMPRTESERLPPFEIISPASTIKNYLYGGISNSPNSTNIQRNIDILLSKMSMNQTIQFSPQQTDNYIENNMDLISTSTTKEFENSNIINTNKEGNLTIELNHEPENLIIPADISEDVKVKSINAAVIESTSPKTPIKNTLKPVAQVNLDTETKFLTQFCIPVKYGPNSVIRHSSSSEQIQVRSAAADSNLNQAPSVEKVKNTIPQYITNSGVLNMPSERTVINKNSLTGDKQLTKINISNILCHSSSGEEIQMHSPTVNCKINQVQRVKEVINSVHVQSNSDVLTIPSERTVTNLLLSNKDSLKVDKCNISDISHSSSSEQIELRSPTLYSKVNQVQKSEKVTKSDCQQTTKSDVVNIPSEKIVTKKKSLMGEKRLINSNISNGTQGFLIYKTSAVNSSQESKRRNEIAMISDRILEEREKMSQACQDEKSLNKIADYLKMFHQRKPVNKSDIKLKAEKIESEIIKERKLRKEETGRDEMMHGVEKPGGQFIIRASGNVEIVNTKNNVLPNFKTLEMISNTNSAVSENSDGIDKYLIKKCKPTTDTSNIDLPHNSPASTSTSTNFATEAQSGAGTSLHLPGTQSFLTFESYSQATFKTYYKHDYDDYDLFQDPLCESHEAAAGVSDDFTTENCARPNKSTDVKQTPSDITSPQFDEFERNSNLNTSLKNVRTYSRRRNKYRYSDTKLIDLPTSSSVNVSLAENDLKIDEFNIGNVSYGLNSDDEKPPRKPYILSRHSVLAQELKRDHFQLEDKTNNKSDKVLVLEQQNDTDVFSLAIEESLKKISPPKKPLKLKTLDLEVSPSTSTDHFSSILPKKRFSRQGSFAKEPRNSCLDESSVTGHPLFTSPKKQKLQIFTNEDELATIRPLHEDLNFFQKKEPSSSKKCMGTELNESQQDNKLQSIGKSTTSTYLPTLENNPLENLKASNTEFMDQNLESTSNDDEIVTELIEIADDYNSQTNAHNVMPPNVWDSTVVSPRFNCQVPPTIINEKVICTPEALNSLVIGNISGDHEKCFQIEPNKSPRLCSENDKKVNSIKLNKKVCRPPKKSIIERVRTDSTNFCTNGVTILPKNDSLTTAPHSVPLQERLDEFSKIGCNGDSLETSHEITVIEENILAKIDSIDKNADMNPSENNNLQCAVISTHSSDQAVIETSIKQTSNSAKTKDIKARETRRKIKGIPNKVKSFSKKQFLAQKMNQIQPAEEGLTEIMTNVEQINNIENDNGLQSSSKKTDYNTYPETHIYSTVLASNDVLEKIHEAVRRESISAVDKSDSSYEDIVQIEIAEDPEDITEVASPTLNDDTIGVCELSRNNIDTLDSITEETITDMVSQVHNGGSDIDNNDSMDGDYSTAYSPDTHHDDHDLANAEGEPTDESWNTSLHFEQPRKNIDPVFNNVEKGNEENQNINTHPRNSSEMKAKLKKRKNESETISKNKKQITPTKKLKKAMKKKAKGSQEDIGEKCLENPDNTDNENLNGPDDDCPLSAIKNFDQPKPRGKVGRPRKQPAPGRPVGRPPKKSEKSSCRGKDTVTCAVCKQKLKKSSWPLHNLNIHKYLSWVEGDKPVDLQNENLLISLVTMAKRKGDLVCEKCGEKRASVLGYISHVLYMCQKTEEEIDALKETCTICSRRVLPSGMRVHILAHTRSSIKAEKPPPVQLPVEDETGARRKRKAAEKAGHTFKKLKKSEQPQRDLKELYKKPWFGRATGNVLCIWKKQVGGGGLATCMRCKHQEPSLEAINKHYISTCPLVPEKVYKCLCCVFKCMTEAEVVEHIKEKHPDEIIVKIEESSDSEEDHNDEDNVPDPDSSSDEDEYETDSEEKLFVRPGRKRTSAASNNNQSILPLDSSALSTDDWKLSSTEEIRSFLPSFHFAYRVGANLKKLYSLWNKQFVEKFYSNEDLFPRLVCNPLQALSISEAETYFPESKESIRMANSTTSSCTKNFTGVEWRRYKLFESDLFNGTQTFWCGGPIRGLAWAPGRSSECYVAVATDRSMDGYYKEDQHYKHKGIIQIWSVGALRDKDKGCQRPATMVMGIAHNFGQVWHLTWCPSGCEMAFIPGSQVSQDGIRLGLLAAACSDGNVHIYAVANPQSLITSESNIYATEPVASLKLYRDDTVTLGRTQYHATQVFWSQDLGHRIIAVGYSSGIVALFDLGSTSILLTSRQGNTTVYLPYFNFQAHRTRVTGLVVMPPVAGYSAPVMCVTSPSGCGIWSGDTRTYFRRGPYTGASIAPQWPQVVAFTEDVQPNAGSASILPVRISCGHLDRITIIEAGIIGGAVTPWNGGLLGLGLHGQLSARLHRCPYIPKDRKNSKDKFTHWIWYPEIVDLSKENEQPNDSGKLGKRQGKGISKSGKGCIKSDQENQRKTPVIELASSFEEARENYGILFVNHPKNTPQLDSVYSLSTWPIWESLCLAVPGSPERFNYCAVGGRAGHCRISFTPEIRFPSNYYPGAYKKPKKD